MVNQMKSFHLIFWKVHDLQNLARGSSGKAKILSFEFQGDKTDEKYDALSLMVIELDHTEKKNSHGVPIIPPESHAPGVELVMQH